MTRIPYIGDAHNTAEMASLLKTAHQRTIAATLDERPLQAMQLAPQAGRAHEARATPVDLPPTGLPPNTTYLGTIEEAGQDFQYIQLPRGGIARRMIYGQHKRGPWRWYTSEHSWPTSSAGRMLAGHSKAPQC